MVIAGVLCGTSLDLGDEGLEDEPARSATSRVGHSIIGLQPNGVPYTYSHIRSLVVQTSVASYMRGPTVAVSQQWSHPAINYQSVTTTLLCIGNHTVSGQWSHPSVHEK